MAIKGEGVYRETIVFSFQEICVHCCLPAEKVIKMVEHGIVEPQGRDSMRWSFTSKDLVRLNKARRIERDLEVNLPGIALSLELIDQIEELKARLRGLGVIP